MSGLTAAQVAHLLDLQPLPLEGGRFRRTFADRGSSAIYYLLADDEFSALHRLTGPELYHWYAGAPVRLLVLDERSGSSSEPLLGNDLVTGQRPQLVVPAGTWQGSSSCGAWSLIGTTMAPGYTDDQFTLGERKQLTDRFPQAADRIRALTR